MTDLEKRSQQLNSQVSEIETSYAAGKRDFSRINLASANLRGIKLNRAELTRANLEGVNLMLASLKGAYLTRVNLSYSNLVEADLSGANLIGANLNDADLSNANCAGAFFNEANLCGASLSQVNLSGAFLYKANLTQTNLKGAFYDEKTCFDQGFDPIAAQMVKRQVIDLDADLELELMLNEGLIKLEEIEAINSLPQPLKGGNLISESALVHQNDMELAQQIRQLLQELSQNHDISSYTQKMKVVVKAAQRLTKDPTWKIKTSNLKSVEKREAFLEAIDHPLAPPLFLLLNFE